jgi:hypothetical protein
MSTTDKALQEGVEQDAHHRLLCAIEGRPYDPPAERARRATLVEALRRGAPLTDVLAEGHAPLPEDAHAHLVAAVRGETYVALPSLPDDGFHARLVRAVQR